MAEGAPLLREYTLTRIVGSNPILSAIFLISRQFAAQTPPIERPDRPGRGRAPGGGFEDTLTYSAIIQIMN